MPRHLNLNAAVAAATRLGFPVAVKFYFKTNTHKTEVNGVHLDVHNVVGPRPACAPSKRVRAHAGGGNFLGVTVQRMIPPGGYKLVLGGSINPQFGPVLLISARGELVGIFQNHTLGFPPLNSTLARRLMERRKIHGALNGVRVRRSVGLPALEQILVRFSQIVVYPPNPERTRRSPIR